MNNVHWRAEFRTHGEGPVLLTGGAQLPLTQSGSYCCSWCQQGTNGGFGAQRGLNTTQVLQQLPAAVAARARSRPQSPENIRQYNQAGASSCENACWMCVRHGRRQMHVEAAVGVRY